VLAQLGPTRMEDLGPLERDRVGQPLGPVYVGLWASATDPRGAMIAVAALGLALAGLTLPLLALSRYAVTPDPSRAT